MPPLARTAAPCSLPVADPAAADGLVARGVARVGVDVHHLLGAGGVGDQGRVDVGDRPLDLTGEGRQPQDRQDGHVHDHARRSRPARSNLERHGGAGSFLARRLLDSAADSGTGAAGLASPPSPFSCAASAAGGVPALPMESAGGGRGGGARLRLRHLIAAVSRCRGRDVQFHDAFVLGTSGGSGSALLVSSQSLGTSAGLGAAGLGIAFFFLASAPSLSCRRGWTWVSTHLNPNGSFSSRWRAGPRGCRVVLDDPFSSDLASAPAAAALSL